MVIISILSRSAERCFSLGLSAQIPFLATGPECKVPSGSCAGLPHTVSLSQQCFQPSSLVWFSSFHLIILDGSPAGTADSSCVRAVVLKHKPGHKTASRTGCIGLYPPALPSTEDCCCSLGHLCSFLRDTSRPSELAPWFEDLVWGNFNRCKELKALSIETILIDFFFECNF